MSKIFLDKIVSFSDETYNKYTELYQHKDNEINIDKIKKNIILNENAFFNKYNYCDIKDIVLLDFNVNLSETVLIYPLWYETSILEKMIHSLLFINDIDYLNDNNNLKKYKIDKKKIQIDGTNDKLTQKTFANFIDKFCINIILIDKDNINIFSQNYENTAVLVEHNNEIYPVLDFTTRYFIKNSNFIKDLFKNKKTIKISIDTYFNKKYNLLNNDLTNNDLTNNNMTNNNLTNNNMTNNNLTNNNLTNNDLTNNDINDITKNTKNTKNNMINTYKEIESSEQNILYLTECNIKNIDENANKKINIGKKNLFIAQKIEENNSCTSSIFKDVEKHNITQKDVEKIKISMSLTEIQAFALKLNIPIICSSTKTGKVKNKTKNDLFNEIKNAQI